MYELKQHKPWFDVECLHFLDQRKQAKMQWSQGPDQSNVAYLNNVICEASKQFKNKKKEYLKNEIDELETNRKIKNTRNLMLLISVSGSNIENKFLIIFSLFY